MSLSNIFDVFEIPTETQIYIRGRIREISDNATQMDINHLDRCFDGKQAMVDYSPVTGLFKYVDFFSNMLPTLDESGLLDTHPSPHDIRVRITGNIARRFL